MATPSPADLTRQAYLERLRTKQGIHDFGLNYFMQRGNDPTRNPFAKAALERAENALPLLTDIYGVDVNSLEGKLGDYFSGNWRPSGQDIMANRDRLGNLEGSIFATGDPAKDQAAWQGATLLGHADKGNNWASAYDAIEQRRAGQFNAMLAEKAATGNPWEGFFSAWRRGMPGLTGVMPEDTQPGGGNTPTPGSEPVPPGTPGAPAPGTPAPGTPAPGTPAPGTPAPGTPAPAPAAPFTVTAANGVATLSGGSPDQVRKWMQENRSPTGHPDAPAISSFRIGPYLYQAPRDTARKFRDSNGNGRYMGSGFNKLLERSDLLMSQGVAKNWYEAMTQAIDWIMSRGSGFGFSRVA